MRWVAPALVVAVTAIFNAILRAEYDRWARPFARVVIWLAGAINQYRADEWRADIAALHDMDDPALLLALGHLFASPWLLVAESILRCLYWMRRNVEEVGWWLTMFGAIVSLGAAATYIVGHATPLLVAMAFDFGVGIQWGVFDANAEDGPEALLPLTGTVLGLVLVLGEVGRHVLPGGRVLGVAALLVGYVALRLLGMHLSAQQGKPGARWGPESKKGLSYRHR